MSYNVKFLQGLETAYEKLQIKDPNTFYYTTDKKNLYLGEIKLSNAVDFAAEKELLKTDIDANTASIIKLNGGTGVSGSVDQKIKTAIDAIKAKDIEIEAIDGLAVSPANIQQALIALKNAINTSETEANVVVKKTSTSPLVYTITQGSKSVGTINIPKDMVVESGKVVNKNNEGTSGTFIELKLANVEKMLYIDVATLVDNYTAAAANKQIKVSVNAETRQISATLVANGVGTTELATGAVTNSKLGADAVDNSKLADNAVQTENIKDGNVTKLKLDSGVQTSLNKANSALQKSDITEGSTQGTISVGGTAIQVHGLGSAAYATTSTFETPSGAQSKATKALTDAKTYTDTALTWGNIE